MQTEIDYLNENGFTLLDVILAVLIITLGLLAYGKFTGDVVDQNKHSKNVSVATLRAQEKLEDLKNLSVNSPLATGNGSDTVDTIFSRSWTIANGGAGNVATITVTVSWTDQTARTVTLSTLISQ